MRFRKEKEEGFFLPPSFYFVKVSLFPAPSSTPTVLRFDSLSFLRYIPTRFMKHVQDESMLRGF